MKIVHIVTKEIIKQRYSLLLICISNYFTYKNELFGFYVYSTIHWISFSMFLHGHSYLAFKLLKAYVNWDLLAKFLYNIASIIHITVLVLLS